MTPKPSKTILKELEKLNATALADKYKTALDKARFINTLKSGMGENLKNNPNKFTVIKKTRWQRFKISLKKLFTKL